MRMNETNTATVTRSTSDEKSVLTSSAALLTEETRPYYYTGKVELEVSFPVDLKMVAALYDTIQKNPEIKIINTRGTFNRGFSITLHLDKPMPLINTLASRLTEVDVRPAGMQLAGLNKGGSSIISASPRKTDLKEIVLTSKRN